MSSTRAKLAAGAVIAALGGLAAVALGSQPDAAPGTPPAATARVAARRDVVPAPALVAPARPYAPGEVAGAGTARAALGTAAGRDDVGDGGEPGESHEREAGYDD